MNFNFYIFGNPGGQYGQYPQDYTEDILAPLCEGVTQARGVIYRRGDLMHYVLIEDLGDGRYAGVCVIFNKIRARYPKRLFELLRDLLERHALENGKILKFTAEGKIDFTCGQLHDEQRAYGFLKSVADATLEKKSGEYGLESLTTNYSGDSQTEYTDYNKSDAAIVRLSEGSATVVIDGIDGVIGASNAGTPRPKITGPVGTRSAQKPRRIWLIAAVAALVCLLGAAGCWLIFGLPVAHDPDAGVPRRYPLVNVSLRTTPMAGGDFNKICVVPYGAELICYENDGMWSRVKYVPADPTQPIREGYAASTYLLDSADFHRLHDIFANDEARQVIETSKCRKALLKYFKDNGYWGVKPPSTEQPLPDPYPEWQVYVTPGDKLNEVYFKRISNPQSRYTDFAVVLRRRGSEARGTRLLYFTFDDDEAAHLMGEMGLYGLTRIDSFSKSAGSSEVTFRALSDSKEYGGYFVFLLGHTFRHNCGSEDEDPGIAMMSFNHMEDLKE